jgi:hypothetical protein
VTVWNVSTGFSAAGGIPAAARADFKAIAGFQGAGGLGANPRTKFNPLVMGFQGAGALAGGSFPAFQYLTGGGVDLTGGGVLFQEPLSILSTLQVINALAGSFAGAGGLGAQALDIVNVTHWQIASLLAGAGTFQPQLAQVWATNPASFPGAGGLAYPGAALLPGRAAFPGAGGLAYPGAALLPGRAAFQGAGALDASIIANLVLQELFAGAGGFLSSVVDLAPGVTLDATAAVGSNGQLFNSGSTSWASNAAPNGTWSLTIGIGNLLVVLAFYDSQSVSNVAWTWDGVAVPQITGFAFNTANAPDTIASVRNVNITTGSVTGNVFTTSTLTAIGAGDSIVGYIQSAFDITLIGLKDNIGNVYEIGTTTQWDSFNAYVTTFYGTNIPSGPTSLIFTFNAPPTIGDVYGGYQEFSGAASVNAITDYTNDSGNSPSASVTTTVVDCMLVSIVNSTAVINGGTITAPSGYTIGYDNPSGDGGYIAYDLVTSATSYTATWTSTHADFNTIALVALAPTIVPSTGMVMGFALSSPASGSQTLSGSWTGASSGYVAALSLNVNGGMPAFINLNSATGTATGAALSVATTSALDFAVAIVGTAGASTTGMSPTSLNYSDAGPIGNFAAGYGKNASSVSFSDTTGGGNWVFGGVDITVQAVTAWAAVAAFQAAGYLSPFAQDIPYVIGLIPTYLAGSYQELGNNGGSAASYTAAFTISSNILPCLMVYINTGNSPVGGATTITFNGVSLAGPYGYIYPQWAGSLWLLTNAPQGTHNIIVNYTGGNEYIALAAWEYDGVQIASQPDGSSSITSGVAENTFSSNYTPVHDGCVIVAMAQGDGSAGVTPTTVGPYVARNAVPGSGKLVADAGPISPPGPVTFSATIPSGGTDYQDQYFISLLGPLFSVTSFSGAGGMRGFVTDYLSAGSVPFSGMGSLFSTLIERDVAQAAFAGIGGVAYPGAALLPNTAAMLGSGGFSTATPLATLPMAGTFAGTGTLDPVPVLLYQTATSQFLGAGLLYGDTVLIVPAGQLQATASFVGTGALAALGISILPLSVPFPGAGSMTATQALSASTGETFSGVGLMGNTAGPTINTPLAVGFPGSGRLAASAILAGLANAAVFSGSGGLSIYGNYTPIDLLTGGGTVLTGGGVIIGEPAQQPYTGLTTLQLFNAINSSLAGSGYLAALTQQWLAGQAAFLGIGGLRYPGALVIPNSIGFLGAGGLTAQPAQFGQALASLAASGQLTATLQQVEAVLASLAASGQLTTVSQQASAILAPFLGSGSLQSPAALDMQVLGSFLGAGGLASLALDIPALFILISALLGGSGGLVGSGPQVAGVGTAAFSGAGAATSALAQKMAVISLLAGAGGINSQPAANLVIFDALVGSGSLTAMAALMSPATSAVFSGSGGLSIYGNYAPIEYLGGGAAVLTGGGVIIGEPIQPYTGLMTLQLFNVVNAVLAGAGSLTAYPQLRAETSIGLAGAGGLQSQIAQMWRTNPAAFLGTGGIASSALDLMLASAVVAGSGGLGSSISSSTTFPSASFSGAGTLTIAQQSVLASSLAFQGSGTFSSNIVALLSEAMGLAGAGGLQSQIAQMWAINPAAFLGAGGLGANALDIPFGVLLLTMLFAGSGGLDSTQQVATFPSLALQGAGALASSIKQSLVVGTVPAFTGTGTLGMAPSLTMPTAGSFAATAGFNATLVNSFLAQLSFAGSGQFTTAQKMTLAASLALTSSGTFASNVQALLAGPAALAGAGAVNVQTIARLPAFSAFVGAGIFSPYAAIQGAATFWMIMAALAGAGQFGAAQVLIATTAAKFTGSGTVGAVPAMTMPTLASLAGAGTMGTTPAQLVTVASKFTGSGTVGVVPTQIWHATASFIGGGAVRGILGQVQQVTIAFAGSGIMGASARQRNRRSRSPGYWQINI